MRARLFGIARNVLLQSLGALGGSGRPERDRLTTGGLRRVPEEAACVTQRLVRDDALATVLARFGTPQEEDRPPLLCCGLERQTDAEVASVLEPTPSAAAKRWEGQKGHLGKELGGLLGPLALF